MSSLEGEDSLLTLPFIGGFTNPNQGLCPWTPVGALPSDPRYRLGSTRSPWSAPFDKSLIRPEVEDSLLTLPIGGIPSPVVMPKRTAIRWQCNEELSHSFVFYLILIDYLCVLLCLSVFMYFPLSFS